MRIPAIAVFTATLFFATTNARERSAAKRLS